MLTDKEDQELLQLIELAELDYKREHHLNFIEHCWMKDASKYPFIVGFHTRKICNRIDKAIEDFKNGISTNILISVHHRSGKSDIVSRYLGPHFLGEIPTEEIMQVTYTAELAGRFSGYGRNIMRSPKYRELYPNVQLSKEVNKKNEWLIMDEKGESTGGKLFASGLHSGLTGNGFSLGILDDYCSGRQEAESEVQRRNAWESFTNDFMTRMAPVSIIIILATRWHWDDINGRIKEAMKEDPNFPVFENLSFPAKAEDYKGEGSYPGKYLFLERFSEKWYLNQYATLGRYAAAALLDSDPDLRLGGQLSTEGIVFCDVKNCPDFLRLKWARVWDLAHTEKQRQKDSPDFTSGTLLAFQTVPGDPVMHLWIRHVHRCQLGATKRDKEIKQIVDMDGAFVRQGVENSVESKDAYDYLKTAMPQVSWNEINIHCGDKTVRATPLEPIFEAPGHVHVVRSDWNEAWLNEVKKFTGTGKEHDDQIDNMSAGYIMLVKHSLFMSEKHKQELAERRKKR